MKKILLSILFAFCFFISFGQNIINRSNSSVTASDARLQAALNLYVPRFVDTTAANLSIGLDSCGAVIFTYNVNWYWIRQCSPKRWSMLPTVNGSLVSNVYIVDSNHIAICNINSCDTIQVNGIQGPITNITIINNTSIRVCGSDILGTEQISNGAFAGSAAGWTLGVLWAYGSNDISHSFGSTASSFQGGGLVEGGSYFVELDITGGTVGTVAVSLDAGTSQTYGPAAGSVSFTGTWNAGINSKINLVPTNDFDGNITNVSVKQLLPNCDTLQIVPTNFTDSVRIYVVTPLHALNDSTFYISQAGPTIRGGDSGYLSTAGYDTFLNKQDSNTHFAQNNIDILQFVKNGVTTNWDTVHVNCYGLEEPGQVLWSGFGLDYIVNSAFYRLNCKPYISPSTVLTLDPADATLARIDLVYVDSSGNAGVLTGTPAVNPVKPQIDPFWQLELTTITVPATATINPIDTLIIYNENVAAPTEWVPVTNVGTTTDPDNTLFVYRGVKSLNVTNINIGDSIIFTKSSSVDLSAYQSVVFFIKLKEVIPSTAQLRVQWQNGGTFVGGMVNIPIDKNNTTTYQAISLPLTLFNLSSTTVTRFVFSYSASNATVNLGFFLDFIYLQNGVAPIVPTDQTTIVGYSGLTHFKVNNIDSIRLGGTLNQNTTENTAGFTTTFTGNNTGANTVLSATTIGTSSAFTGTATSGNGANGIATSGRGVYGFATSGIGGFFESNSSYGLQTVSSTGIAANFTVFPTSTSTVIPIFTATRTTSGTAANGIGGSFDFYVEGTAGAAVISNQIISKFTNATTATRESQLILTGVDNTTTKNLFTLLGTGQATLDQYTTSNFNGGVAADSVLVITSAGVIKKRDAAAFGGGGISADNGLTINTGTNVQLGGSLLGNTGIATGAFTLTLSTGVAGTPISVTATSGPAITATASSGTGAFITGTGAFGVVALDNTGIAIQAWSNDGLPLQLFKSSATTNTVSQMMTVGRNTSGTPGNGIGSSIDFITETTGGFSSNANQLISKFTDATTATRTSQFIVAGVLSATEVNILTMNADGSIQWRPITATAASAITPAEGMVVFVSSTNGTFLSIGFWGYRNGAWAAF